MAVREEKSDKWKAMFAGLGRPTNRGVRKCPKCGTVNGTRGNSCKNKACDVVFRPPALPPKNPITIEASRISTLPGTPHRIYSVRLRDRGPDYRTFVQIPEMEDQMDSEEAFADSECKCYAESCNRKKSQAMCSHILAAQRCYSHSQPVAVKRTQLDLLNIPTDYMEVISNLIDEVPDVLVQRVSKTSFVINCQPSSRHPLGFLHILFIKLPKDDGNLEKRFQCNCRPIKFQGRDAESDGSNSPETGNKICLHYYICVCAFASNETLATEFGYFIQQIGQDYGPTQISRQLQIVTLPSTTSEKTLDNLDPTHNISVEIMRENISLLESIAAGDDPNLANGLDLSDQIIVTNVHIDETLNVDGEPFLEGLDDADQQVCQIFANGQNTIQLTTFTTSDHQEHIDVIDIRTTEAQIHLENEDEEIERRNQLKRKKGDKSCCTESLSQPVEKNPVVTTTFLPSQLQNPVSFTTTTFTSNDELPSCKASLAPGFEEWLSGVNDRINHTMHYLLKLDPDPLIYFISSDYFECLKKRIIGAGKKSRLPNQTLLFTRTDKAPVGTFTKHIWRLNNAAHIAHIFQCSLVSLKTRQYFVKHSNGNFVEWIPPVNQDEKNTRILPVLHSTYLKCGRDPESRNKDIFPFVIEWIPDILKDSKMGELTLRFEFGRTGPIHEDESRVSMASLFRGGNITFITK